MKLTKNLKKILSVHENSVQNISNDKSSLNNLTSYSFLPPLKASPKKTAYLKSYSVLTKFIDQHTKDIIRSTEKDLSRPIKIPNYKKKNNQSRKPKIKKIYRKS